MANEWFLQMNFKKWTTVVLAGTISIFAAIPAQATDSAKARELNNKGVSALQSGNYREAFESLQQALKLDPSYEKARDNLAIAYNNYGLVSLHTNPEQAFKLFRLSYFFSPKEITLQNLAGAYKKQNKNPDDLIERLKIAADLRKNGEFEQAITEYCATLKLKEDPTVRIYLGDLYKIRGNYRSSISHYQKALSTSNAGLIQLRIGQCAISLNDYKILRDSLLAGLSPNTIPREDAYDWRSLAEECVKMNPTAPDAHIFLGQVFQLLGDFGEAEAEYKQAIALSQSQNNPRAQELLANVRKKPSPILKQASSMKNETDVAPPTVASYAQAPVPGLAVAKAEASAIPTTTLTSLPLANNSPSVKVSILGNGSSADFNQLMSQNKFSDAVKVLEEVLKKSPLEQRAWFNLGICRQALKDFDGALAAYQMVLTLNPQDAQATVAAAQVRGFLAAKKVEKTKLEEERAANVARRQSIDSLIGERQFDEAQKIVEDLLKTDSVDSTLWFKLGQCKQGRDDNHGALAAYEMSNRLDVSNGESFSAAKTMRAFLAGSSTELPPLSSAKPLMLERRKEVDFDPYLQDLKRRIRRAWYPPKGAQNLFIAVFKIHRDGQMTNLRLGKSSGRNLLDQSGLKAVENAAPFLPLPDGANDDEDFAIQFNSFSRPSANGDARILFIEPPNTGTFRQF